MPHLYHRVHKHHTHPLPLHSFPTRRSSDLSQGIRTLPGSLNDAVDLMEGSDLVREALGEHVFGFFIRNKRQERSEEHTSELQSRGHLVCRLLLEKKKHLSCSHLTSASANSH